MRTMFLDRRKAMPSEIHATLSQKMCEILLDFLQDREGPIGGFNAFRGEPCIDFLRDKVDLVWPRVEHHSIFYIRSDLFALGAFGITEPQGSEVVEPMMLLVPGLGFSREGYRLGYGGGYYDRYLSSRNCIAVGVCFEDFLEDTLPRESFDRKMNYIVTDSKVIEVR